MKRFVWADVYTSKLYFSTTTTVWGLTDTGPSGMEDWRVTSIVSPSTPLLAPATTWVYVGGGDGRLHQLDLSSSPPTIASLTLGDGLSAVGSPALEVSFPPFAYVGTDAAAVYAVAISY